MLCFAWKAFGYFGFARGSEHSLFFPHFLFLHTRPNSLPRQSSTLRISKFTTLLRSRQFVLHHQLYTLSFLGSLFCLERGWDYTESPLPTGSAFDFSLSRRQDYDFNLLLLSLAAVRDQPAGL